MTQSDRELERDAFILKHFRDWPGGSTPVDGPGRLRCVRVWLHESVAPFRAAALALIASVRGVLDEVEQRISPVALTRLFYRIDTEHVCKEPESILEKMIRKGVGSDGEPTLSFENFREQMSDLARFRVVTNFLSDAELVRRELGAAFGTRTLSEAQKKLREGFQLENNNFNDCTRVAPGARQKGERCFKGVFWPRGNPSLKVEVQVMTILQEAWDKKDHFLVYEPRRRGQNVLIEDEIEIFAMSELLYVADLTFDRIRQRILGEEGASDAASR